MNVQTFLCNENLYRKLALTLAIIRLTPSHLNPRDFTIQLQNNLRRKRNNDEIQFEQVLVDICLLRKSTRAIRIPTHVLDLLDHHGRFLQNVFTHSVDLNIELQTLIMETIDRLFELMKQNLLRIQDETYEIMFKQLITMIASYSVIPNIQKHCIQHIQDFIRLIMLYIKQSKIITTSGQLLIEQIGIYR